MRWLLATTLIWTGSVLAQPTAAGAVGPATAASLPKRCGVQATAVRVVRKGAAVGLHLATTQTGPVLAFVYPKACAVLPLSPVGGPAVTLTDKSKTWLVGGCVRDSGAMYDHDFTCHWALMLRDAAGEVVDAIKVDVGSAQQTMRRVDWFANGETLEVAGWTDALHDAAFAWQSVVAVRVQGGRLSIPLRFHGSVFLSDDERCEQSKTGWAGKLNPYAVDVTRHGAAPELTVSAYAEVWEQEGGVRTQKFNRDGLGRATQYRYDVAKGEFIQVGQKPMVIRSKSSCFESP